MMALLAAASVVLQGGLSRRWRLGAALVALPVLLGLLLTMTRSAWAGLALGALAMLLAARPRLLLPASLLAAAWRPCCCWRPRSAAGAHVPPDQCRDRGPRPQHQPPPDHVAGRCAMVRAHPLTGVGDRDLRAVGPLYYEEDPAFYHGHLHSNLVMFAAIWGLPGWCWR